MVEETVFTFWEGKMPAYIELCMQTWKFPYVLLNFENLPEYIPVDIEPLKRFSLPQMADYIRVHLLREYGGYWLDVDTVMLTQELPTENIFGDPVVRTNTIGMLHVPAHFPMMELWADYQDAILTETNVKWDWSMMGNAFTDKYLRKHGEINIGSIENHWAETYMVAGNAARHEKYKKFYFEDSYELKDLRPTNMLMLHNSWTPAWYRQLERDEVLQNHCTLSNILRGLV